MKRTLSIIAQVIVLIFALVMAGTTAGEIGNVIPNLVVLGWSGSNAPAIDRPMSSNGYCWRILAKIDIGPRVSTGVHGVRVCPIHCPNFVRSFHCCPQRWLSEINEGGMPQRLRCSLISVIVVGILA